LVENQQKHAGCEGADEQPLLGQELQKHRIECLWMDKGSGAASGDAAVRKYTRPPPLAQPGAAPGVAATPRRGLKWPTLWRRRRPCHPKQRYRWKPRRNPCCWSFWTDSATGKNPKTTPS